MHQACRAIEPACTLRSRSLHAGQEQGRWQGYYRGGASRFRGAYSDGAPAGEWTSSYPDGKPLSVGRYEAGKKVGKWTYWDENGKKEEVGQPP